MPSAYDPFADAYERWFGPEAAPETWAELRRLLRPQLRPGARVLDLGCGTGEITARLVRRGCRVHGVDGSAAMLAYARRRAPAARFSRADLADYAPRGRYDAAIAAYNCLAELTDAGGFARLLARLRPALRPGGALVFDLFEPAAYQLLWRGSYAKQQDGFACLVRARYRARLRRGELRIALRTPLGPRRLAIITRAYAAEEVAAALAAAGFTRFSTRRSASGRTFYRAFAPANPPSRRR